MQEHAGTSRGKARAVWQRESESRALWRSLRGLVGGEPEFLVIGAQRAGTTSLFQWLDAHPAVLMSRPKEVHYFDLQHHRGRRWYRSHFPRARRGVLRGEATPYYLYHPLVPGRVRAELPDARLVVLLRDPAERAHSQFRHERRLGFESLEDFEEALAGEEGRLSGEAERLARDPSAESYAHNHHGYLDRGRYAAQLERWFEHFPREQVHVLFSEELFAEPGRVLGELAGFLGLDPGGAALPHANAAPGSDLDPGLRARILADLEADDERLAGLLGRSLPWREA
jgi:hypothetical protein